MRAQTLRPATRPGKLQRTLRCSWWFASTSSLCRPGTGAPAAYASPRSAAPEGRREASILQVEQHRSKLLTRRSSADYAVWRTTPKRWWRRYAANSKRNRRRPPGRDRTEDFELNRLSDDWLSQ